MQPSFLKKTVVLFAVICSFQTLSVAQTYSNKTSSILGFSVGLTSSNLINDSIHYKSGILYSGGLAYSVMLNNRFNVAIEANYIGKAFKSDSPIIKHRYYFLEIPVYAQINLGENMRINAGIQYAIATNAQLVTLDDSKANGVRFDNVPNIKTADYGILAGFEFDAGKSVGLGLRYSLSGSTFLEKHGTNFGVFQLSLKYFPIKTHRVFFGKKEVQQ